MRGGSQGCPRRTDQRNELPLAPKKLLGQVSRPSLFSDLGISLLTQLTVVGSSVYCLRLAHNAVSLGGMETLVCHPGSTTHSGCSLEERRIAGITDGLVRISIGVEDWRDLLGDFESALEQSAKMIASAAG